MNHYYFNNNTDENGNHEVHIDTCSKGASPSNRIYIGYYSDCKEAIKTAKIMKPLESFDGCYFCCNKCHKG